MKYLEKRNKFLESFKGDDKKYTLVSESVYDNSGPFANDIPWGSSLLGRLINSAIRKGKIKYNLTKIDKVGKRLQRVFNDLDLSSSAAQLSDDDKKMLNKITYVSMLYKLKECVDNAEDYDLKEIKSITNSTISKIEDVENIENKETLLKRLNKWKEFLNSLDNEEEKEDEPVDSYSLYVNNFKSVLNICISYKAMQNQKKKEPIQVLEKDPEKKDQNVEVKVNGDKVEKQNSNYIYESDGVKDESSKNPIIIALKSLYTFITSQMTMDDASKFMKLSPDLIKSDRYKNSISKIYTHIRKKSGVNEDINTLLTRPESLGDKIYELYKISKTKQDCSFEGISDDIKSTLINFNKSMSSILSIKNESLFSYSNFKKIYESESPEYAIRIKKWWGENMKLDPWLLSKDEILKIKNDLDKKLSENKDQIIINGLDPIIEIIKCFNNAYKIHTTMVIPTGRNRGEVSNKTFREYTSFGSGSPESAGTSGGPYRNNSLFDKWEDFVLNIIKETKYQKIFRSETVLKTSEGNIIKRAGKNLLKFMNDMLDGDKLYKGSEKGAQAKFLKDYFDVDEKEIEKTTNGDNDLEALEKDVNKVANEIKSLNLNFTSEKMKFEKFNKLNRSIFASNCHIKGEQKVIYFFIQSMDADYCYILYSLSFHFFLKYIKSVSSINSITEMRGNLPLLIKTDSNYMLKSFRIKHSNLVDKDGSFRLLGKHDITYMSKYENGKNDVNNAPKISENPDEIDFKTFYTLRNTEDGDSVRYILDGDFTNSIKANGGFINIAKSEEIKNTKIVKK